MEHCSALLRNELSSREETWRNLECILLCERSLCTSESNLKMLHVLYDSKYMTFLNIFSEY